MSNPAPHTILLALDYLQRAEDFIGAFRALPPGNPPSWPRYFLLCHAIELALKAFLISRGISSRMLKSAAFRHNLKQLLSEAVNLGLPLGLLARTELEHLDNAHAEFWPRYPRPHAKPVFVIDPFAPYADELLRAVASRLRSIPTAPP
jgi:hypothetical protein